MILLPSWLWWAQAEMRSITAISSARYFTNTNFSILWTPSWWWTPKKLLCSTQERTRSTSSIYPKRNITSTVISLWTRNLTCHRFTASAKLQPSALRKKASTTTIDCIWPTTNIQWRMMPSQYASTNLSTTSGPLTCSSSKQTTTPWSSGANKETTNKLTSESSIEKPSLKAPTNSISSRTNWLSTTTWANYKLRLIMHSNCDRTTSS